MMKWEPFEIHLVAPVAIVIGKDKYSEIGKKRYLKNGNNDAVKTAASVQ